MTKAVSVTIRLFLLKPKKSLKTINDVGRVIHRSRCPLKFRKRNAQFNSLHISVTRINNDWFALVHLLFILALIVIIGKITAVIRLSSFGLVLVVCFTPHPAKSQKTQPPNKSILRKSALQE